jgi:amino acid transporter
MGKAVGLKQTLGIWSVVLFGLAYMSPLIVLGTFGPLAEAAQGTAALSYVIASIGMVLTAFSYSVMARVYPVAGSAYSYARKSLNGHLGFLVGWAVLLDYLFLPMVVWLIGGDYFHTAVPAVPNWVFITGFILVTTIINAIGIDFAARVNTILMIIQIGTLLAFIALAGRYVFLAEGPGGIVSIKPFFGEGAPLSASLAGAALAAFAFLGFDAVSTLTEDTIDAKRVVPRAVMLVAFAGSLFFVAASYMAQLAHPGFAFADVDTGSSEIAKAIGGDIFETIFLAALVVTQFAAGIATQASVGRFLYAMGRDGVLPKRVFGQLHPTWRTPVTNIAIVGAIGFLAIGLDIATSTSFINFGAFLAFTSVNVSVMALYLKRHPDLASVSPLMGLVLPAIAGLFDFYMLFNLDRNAQILGASWLVLGIAYLTYLTGLYRKPPPELDMDFVEEVPDLVG